MTYTYTYHQDADILETFFSDAAATASVYLTPDIILHFQAEERRAVSLIFNNFTFLTQQAEYGPQALQLTTERWPESLRSTVWELLTHAPIDEWLAVSTYRSPRMRHAIPLATMRAGALSLAA
jgi:queuine/archaeosine tRNA-ribosyltransferase